jgi:acetyl-CoA acetyltransferase
VAALLIAHRDYAEEHGLVARARFRALSAAAARSPSVIHPDPLGLAC